MKEEARRAEEARFAEKTRLASLARAPLARVTACLEYGYPSEPSLPSLVPGSSFRLPPSLFPIVATLLEIHFFDDLPDSDFSSCITAFTSLLPAHLSTIPAGDRVTLILSLANIPRHFPSFRRYRVRAFLSPLQPVVNSVITQFFRSLLSNLELLTNRLATAKFDPVSLIEDCHAVFQRASELFAFTPQINRFLMTQFLADFQIRAGNKILRHPARFTFTNAMIWNTFISALENDLRVSLPFLREVVLLLNMAPTIAERPQIAVEICPKLALTTVGFVLQMYMPDETFPTQLNATPFMERYKVFNMPREVTLPDLDAMGFDNITDMQLERWNVRNLGPVLSKQFKYLAAYLAR
jgi:hypothetical protein